MPSDSAVPERPRQVTLAGWLIVVGSVLVVLSAFERISGLHSLETQDAISDFLSRPPGDGLGLSLDGAQSLLRVLALVGGAAGAAAAILGYQVLARSRSARVALTVLALPLFVGGMAVSGFVAALVVVSVLMLWLQPAKDWFNGVAPAARRAEAGVPVPTPVPTGGPVRPDQARLDPTSPDPTRPDPTRPDPTRPAQGRPAPVTAACIVTWVFCGIALALLGMTVLVLVAAPDLVFDEVRRQDPDFASSGLDEAEVRQAAFAGSAVLGVWCLTAIGFAVAAFNGYRWGRLALVISTAAAGAVTALLMLGSLALVVPMAAAAVTVGLLLRPESKAWCRRTPGRRGSVSS
jgi:hypothetical protein